MVKGLFIMDKQLIDQVYPPHVMQEIDTLADIIAPPLSREEVLADKRILSDVEVIFSGWGGPTLDAEFLAAAPRFKALFYGAGTIKHIVTDAFWDQGHLVTTANVANAVPVAEFTLSQILFAMKNGWSLSHEVKRGKRFPDRLTNRITGTFGSTVGLISLSSVGRRVNELLQPFDMKVLAYDPFVNPSEAGQLRVTLASIEEIFAKADVVSLHSPLLKETEGTIRGAHFASMKSNATFINTARGAIVNEPEMIEVLRKRLDITAILDVTFPEPPEPESALYALPNVVLTPHIAGSMGNETGRLGAYMLEEFRRFVAGEQLKYQVTREAFNRMA